ncbi:cytochrome-c peroxidase [Bernardetia sp.]|uniref:cytochrome-c peroxidase n=1 Tax=Bernardetia sp. TaxID=1937974 RepID=UPI0025C113E6|nr:cytochrome c peroxidase [Bernardetia sp.]
MKNLILSTFFMIFLVSCQTENINPKEEFGFQQPSNFPPPVYDLSENPITVEGFELGKKLFYTGLLSRDGTVSCGSCHQQTSSFTQHGHSLSHGIDDQLTMRNSQPIQNLAWSKSFFWDGGVFHLDLFAPVPIEADNEMGETLPNVLQKLRETEGAKSPKTDYPLLFEKAFGTKEITTANFLKALSQFQLMCISSNSRYDKHIRNESTDENKLTAQELKGLELFNQKCATCHTTELFTDYSFRNNGLPIGNPNDEGRFLITQLEEDKFKFKVPSLRNVEVTRPYMHDGRFRNLEAVLDHYADGIVDSETLDPILKKNLKIELNEDEKKNIIAFLKTLTDEEFLNNPLLSEF